MQEESTSRRISRVLSAISDDLSSRTSAPPVALYETRTGAWILPPEGDALKNAIGDYDHSAAWIAAVGGDVFTIESTDYTSAIVEIVSRFQDIVIDDIGRGWPELYREGEFVGLAEPAVFPDGEVGWKITDDILLPFGTLEMNALGLTAQR